MKSVKVGDILHGVWLTVDEHKVIEYSERLYEIENVGLTSDKPPLTYWNLVDGGIFNSSTLKKMKVKHTSKQIKFWCLDTSQENCMKRIYAELDRISKQIGSFKLVIETR